MATTVYSLGAGSTFNQSEALAGRLCIIVASSYDPGEHPTIDASDTTNFKGSGFVKVVNNTLTLVVDNIPWYFDINGIGIGANSNGYKLYLGVVDTTGITVHGNYIEGIHANPQTRSGANSIIIDNLNPLDQFAIQALQSILNKVQNPTDLSDSDVNRYCQAAYQWASNMMVNAANLRNDITDNYTQSQGTATVSSLDSNIEKLLNNLIIELASTNKAHTDEEGVWSKVGQTSVNGYYNDTTAQTLPKTGGGTCSSIADAEADGWSWKASHYSERQENTIVGFQNLINATNLSTLNKAVDTTQGSEKLKIGGNVAVSGGVAVSNASGSNLNVKTANNENVSIKGGDTYNNNGTSISDVIKVAVVAGGGGGGSTGGTVNVNSMPSLTISDLPLIGGMINIGASGLGSSPTNPLHISGGGSSLNYNDLNSTNAVTNFIVYNTNVGNAPLKITLSDVITALRTTLDTVYMGISTKKTPIISFTTPTYLDVIGHTFQKLPDTYSPAYIQLQLIWSSSNSNIATVSDDGTVTCLSSGTSVIKARFEGDQLLDAAEASYTLTVSGVH